LDIQLLGVNAFGHESGVTVATEDRDIPLLQDVDEDSNSLSDTWELWDVTWRDVVILNAENEPVAVYNLTENDLSDPSSYAELKNLLISTADATVAESSISGSVYFDTDNDGARDDGELGISRVLVSLVGTDDQGQQVSRTTRTNSHGQYSFDGLVAGDYVITQTQPSLTIDGTDTIGTAGGNVSNDRFEISLGESEAAEDYLFGERGRSARSVSLTDFFSKTKRDNALLVSDSEGHVQWYCMQGEWSRYEDANVDSDSSEITVELWDGLGTWEGHYQRQDNRSVVQLARVNDQEMVRVAGVLLMAYIDYPEDDLWIFPEGESPDAAEYVELLDELLTQQENWQP
jgi:hypothetical protein